MYDTTEQKKDTEIIALNSIKFDTNEFSVSQLFSVVAYSVGGISTPSR